jgi:predicted Zn-dependent protease
VRERLTPVELAWLTWIRAAINENEEAAHRAMKQAALLAPDRFLFLYAETLRWLNRPAEIVELLKPAGAGSPYHDGRASYWTRLAEAYHQLGQHENELEVATRLRKREPASARGLWAEIRALAALRRTNEVMDRLSAVESFPRQTSPSAGRVLRGAAEELRAHGQPNAAAIALDRAIAWYHGLPREEAAKASNRFEAARVLYLSGKLDQAESHFRQLIIDNPIEWPEYEGALGVIAARRGDRKTAQNILATLERQRLASDPPPKYPLYAQARIVAGLGDRERAVRLLREALGGQGHDLHTDSDFEMLLSHPAFKQLVRPKG